MALIALAINFALSFGHVHAIDGKGLDNSASHRSGALIAAIAPADADQKQGHSDNGHPDDVCPICVAAAAVANGLAPTPPIVPVEFAVATIDHGIVDIGSVVEPKRTAFQPRGPPIS